MKTDEIYNHVNHDSELFRVLKHLPKIGPNGPWLAGGSVWKAIENRPIEYDLDFFFNSPVQFQVWTRMLRSIPYVHHIVKRKDSKYNTSYQFHVCDGKYNKTVTVQGVSFKYWKDTEDLLDGFDFTACQFAMDGRNLYVGDTSFEDLKARSIRFHKIHNSYATKVHLDKYFKEGFKVPGEQAERYEKLIAESQQVRRASDPERRIRFTRVDTFTGAPIRTTPEVVDEAYPQPETPATNVNAQTLIDQLERGTVVYAPYIPLIQTALPAPAATRITEMPQIQVDNGFDDAFADVFNTTIAYNRR